MADKFTLYSYWRSSCSWRIRIALALKNLDYDYKAVNLLKSEQLEEEYKSEFNAMGQVPTLLIEKSDGRKIQLTQSLAIIEYLDQVYDNGPKLIPDDAEAAFRAREIANMIEKAQNYIWQLL
ncbi:unnamed protein product [Oikopleura dioica]|uniref:GST N-terminal domain-containing protein n=1 Tax=Oikopleura dioica TaxID=34765 RepID=E4WWH5_OIKDI|nr:unnamed protein product [Oikopleura dioica]CBY30476.1 unnamed protein product [Oikopleura dioica]